MSDDPDILYSLTVEDVVAELTNRGFTEAQAEAHVRELKREYSKALANGLGDDSSYAIDAAADYVLEEHPDSHTDGYHKWYVENLSEACPHHFKTVSRVVPIDEEED